MDELIAELNKQADLLRDGHCELDDDLLADLLGRAAEALFSCGAKSCTSTQSPAVKALPLSP